MGTTDVQNGGLMYSENEKLAAFYRPVYLELLESLSFINTPEAAKSLHPWDLELTVSITKLLDPSISQDALPQNSLLNSARFGILCCPKHPAKVQSAVAHYAALVTIIDDCTKTGGEKFMRDMELFQVKMCSPEKYAKLFPGRGPLHPLLEDMITFLTTDLCVLFLTHPILHNLFIKSTLDFIAACQLEELHKGKLGSKFNLSPEMQKYPALLRLKSGISEAFTLLVLSPLADEEDEDVFYNRIFPAVAELNDFWTNLNDLLSMYKEVKDGDTVGFIFNYAKVNNMTLHDSVRKVVKHAVEDHKRIMSMADSSDSPKFKEYMVQLYQGYFLWHISYAKRYKLNEVLGDWFAGSYWT